MYEIEIDRESIHKLIDKLPEEEWEMAHWTLLAHLKQYKPVLWSIMTAHQEYIDPYIEELQEGHEEREIAKRQERIAIEEGWTDIEAGRWDFRDKVKEETAGLSVVHRVRLSHLAHADLSSLDGDVRGWILEAFDRFTETGLGNLCALNDRPGEYSQRVWDWCVILRLEDDGHTITVGRVLHRKVE